jgi:hypothetical protein
MIQAGLLLVGLMSSTPEPDPVRLVSQLGAPRFAVREAASRALEERGTVVLAALRAARDDKDPEVRNRAVALVEKIESGMMVKPTLVKLNYEEKPVAEVVKSLSQQTRIQLTLQGDNNPALLQKRITLKSDNPVPFWEAVDRLCQSAGLQTSPAMAVMGPGGRGSGLALSPGAGWTPGPRSDSGPFRIFLTSLHYHKDLTLGQAAQPGFIVPPAPPVAPLGNRVANEQFYFNLQLVAEPRLMIAQDGALTITEAIDNKGNSLLPPAAPGSPMARHSAYNGYSVGFAAMTFQLQGHLRRPDSPGTTIKILKGKVPVSVSTRKDEPLLISLSEPREKVYRNGDLGVLIHDVKFDNKNNQTAIELSVRIMGDRIEGGAMRMPGLPVNQIEIVDAQDHVYQQVYPVNQTVNQTEARMTLRLIPTDGQGVPTKIRYYDLARASTEAVFEFHDVPLP